MLAQKLKKLLRSYKWVRPNIECVGAKKNIIHTKNYAKKLNRICKTKEVFNCGRCKSVLQSERSWKRHRDTVHGGSARLQGDPLGQLFNSEQEERAWNQALASFKKINCPRCNKKTFVKPAPLEQHLKTCCNVIKIVNGKKKRDACPIPEKSVEPVNNVDSPGRSRRKAATKARSTVAAFVKAMKTKFDGESSDGDPEVREVMEDSDDNFNVQKIILITC